METNVTNHIDSVMFRLSLTETGDQWKNPLSLANFAISLCVTRLSGKSSCMNKKKIYYFVFSHSCMTEYMQRQRIIIKPPRIQLRTPGKISSFDDYINL